MNSQQDDINEAFAVFKEIKTLARRDDSPELAERAIRGLIALGSWTTQPFAVEAHQHCDLHVTMEGKTTHAARFHEDEGLVVLTEPLFNYPLRREVLGVYCMDHERHLTYHADDPWAFDERLDR